MNSSPFDGSAETIIEKIPEIELKTNKYWLMLLPLFAVLSILAFAKLSFVIIQGLFLLFDVSLQGSTIGIIFTIIFDLLGIIFLLVLIRKKVVPLNKQVKNKEYGFLFTIQMYLMILTLIIIIGLILVFLWETISPGNSNASPYDSLVSVQSSGDLVNTLSLIILAVIMAPIFEEMLFRRLLIPLLEGTGLLSTGIAIIASATMFGLIHTESDLLAGSIQFASIHFISASIIGLALGLVYVITRDIRYSIFLHAINNAFAVSTLLIITQETDLLNPSPLFVAYNLIFLLMLIAGFILLIKFIFELDKYRTLLRQQFKGLNFQFSNKFGLVLLLLVVEGILFVFLPVFEATVNDVLFAQSQVAQFGLAFLIALLVFSICFIAIIRFKSTLQIIGAVKNKKLLPYTKPQPMMTYPNYYPQLPVHQYPVQPVQSGAMPEPNYPRFCGNCGSAVQQVDGNITRFCPECGYEVANFLK